ncbi:RICIN domain-containing protein [Bacillus mycoides]|uniref:RICIN domain-containing protein n=1 Tax=Bacillus mycoides TaxID=1405 RepID=UPI002E1A3B34|nr:RICIN domain-containing protein [Bacillus mycoides]
MIPNRDQFFKITGKQSGKVMSVDEQSTSNNAHIDQYDWVYQNNQKWLFIPLNNNYYAIVNENSGLVMSVDQQSTANNALIDQYEWHGDESQQWFLKDLENGYNGIQARHSGKFASVDQQSTANNAYIDQYPWVDQNNQMWSLETVESFTLPAIMTYPLAPPPQYSSMGETLPDHTESLPTNYTLAPCIAVEDPYYNNQQKIQTGNEYYLYVRKQYWKKVASHTLAPGESYGYKQISGMTTTDQTTVTKTVSHSFGADVGLKFRKDSVSAGLSYQYSEELSVQESRSETELSVVEEAFTLENPNNYQISWTKYILVSEYSVQRADGTLVNEPWTVTDYHNTYSSFYPLGSDIIEQRVSVGIIDAQQAVYNLFADAQHSRLKIDTTDYMIDQTAFQVEQLSDETYAYEKMMLFNLVRCAKQLSVKRNLLHYGDFESPNWQNQEDGWQASSNVTVLSDNPVFKGRYANMPGAKNTASTYLYQKVDESKLKPYTRYLVRGFVGSSKELELFVTRYGKEVHRKMNIPMNTCSCSMGQVADYTMSNDPCQLYPSGMTLSSTEGLCEDKQHFVFQIDVGEIYQRADLGIGVGFKISSSDGMAQLDNIEVIEANPLTGEALARVKKREQKWKRELEQKCALTEKTVSSATQAVDSLFTNAQKNRLKATTTIQDILGAEAKIKAIPYVYNSYFEEVPGMNYTIFQALQSDVYNASSLYRIRNLIRNGDFSSGLSNWHATAGADVQERDGKSHVLVLSQWDATVSQEVCVQPERGYVLRVTARKGGSGKGYVTLTDCTADNTETVTFRSDDMASTPRPSVPQRPIEPAICDIPRYNESFGIVPEMNPVMNEQPESYGTTSCSCGCGNRIQTPSTPRMPNVTGSSPGYLTKTIEMFPETNRLRIEIGETEGTFLVESIELICMED